MVAAQPSGGSYFMFGGDEPPAKAKRAVRSKSKSPAPAKSAAVEKNVPVADKSAASEASAPVEQ